jgi:hypothetical protein
MAYHSPKISGGIEAEKQIVLVVSKNRKHNPMIFIVGPPFSMTDIDLLLEHHEVVAGEIDAVGVVDQTVEDDPRAL